MNMLVLLATALLAAADIEAPTIAHTPVREAPQGLELVLEAHIQDPSGVFGATLYWREASDPKFTSIELTAEGDGVFSGAIPGSKVTGRLEYYVEAYDQLGNGPVRVGSPETPLLVTVVEPPPGPEPEVIVLPPSAFEEPPTPLRIAPIGVMAGGVALVAVGAAMWFSSSSTIAEIDGRYPEKGAARLPADAEATASAASRSRIGSILMIGGTVATVGGVSWFFMPSADCGAVVGAGGSF